MATDLGKNVYEAEKDIAAQKELASAFVALMAELVKSIKTIAGFDSGINVKKGEGLTVERKAKDQEIAEGLTVERKTTGQDIGEGLTVERKAKDQQIENDDLIAKPEAKPQQEAQPDAGWGRSTQTIYGLGKNNLTDADIKAISAIIAGKIGDTVSGGEDLIIKYNGKPLFETDELGKILLHTQVSPEIKQRFAALQAGVVPAVESGKPKPEALINNAPTASPEQESTPAKPVDRRLENALVFMAAADDGAVKVDGKGYNGKDTRLGNSLADKIGEGTALTQEEAQSGLEMLHKYRKTQLAPAGYQLPKWDEISHQYSPAANEQVNDAALTAETEIAPTSHAEGKNDLGPINDTDFELLPLAEPIKPEPKTIAPPVAEPITAEPQIEKQQAIAQPEQDNSPSIPVAPKPAPPKTIFSKASEYVVDTVVPALRDRAEADTQIVLGAIQDRAAIIPSALIAQYSAIKSRFANEPVMEDTPHLKNSIESYMDNVNSMFDDIDESDRPINKPADLTLAEQPQPQPQALTAEQQVAIFGRQQAKLDDTIPSIQQQAILKAVYRMYLKNLPEDQKDSFDRPGINRVALPTGATLVNNLTYDGISNLSIERDNNKILVGGVSGYGQAYVPADIAKAMPELRQLRPFLSGDLQLSQSPVTAIPINHPLPTPKNEAIESASPKPEINYSLKPQTEPVKQLEPVISRGGR